MTAAKGRQARTVVKSTRWTRGEWQDVERWARAQGIAPAEVVRAAVTWYLGITSEGFEPIQFTDELRAAVRTIINKGRPARPDGEVSK